MARPDYSQSSILWDGSYQPGGPVALMQQAIETQMATDNSPAIPEWAFYADVSSPTNEAIHLLSRSLGVLTLGAAIVASLTGLSQLF